MPCSSPFGQAFIPDAPAHLTPSDWASWGDFRREWPVSLAILLWFIGVVIWPPKLVDIISKRSQEKESGQTSLGRLAGLLLLLFVGGLVSSYVGGLLFRLLVSITS